MPVIGQCNKTVDTLYLCKWTVSDVVAHFAELIVVFLMKTYNWCLFSFSSFVIILSSFVWLIDNRTSSRPILSVIILLINKCNSLCAVVRFLWSLVWLQTELDSIQSYHHYLLHMYKLHKSSEKRVEGMWKSYPFYTAQ